MASDLIRALPTLGEKVCARCSKPIASRAASRNMFCGRNCAAAYRANQRRKPRRVCLACGKAAPNPRQRSCSAQCAYRLRKLKTRPPRQCPVCSKEYFSKGLIRLKYCSQRCRLAAMATEAFEVFDCDQCGKSCQRRKVRTRPHPHRFCGVACRSAFYVGERSSMWRGGSDPNRGARWLKLAAAIRERDGLVCQRCGLTQAENGRRLDVDHIKPWRSFTSEAEANDPINLVSLCKTCHRSKTSGAERAWLRGDRMAMLAYEKAVRLPPLFAYINGDKPIQFKKEPKC